eukprot:CAMPEP_0117050106 /NCGR_PEP_ID=MMETSP0472-20121206/34596_1 /TAXON_ID=693140 ORGANISM="Tiarina fusus, Strain LIS" /NCGR_SAMPLE_ID=MMETSP0472 /ASSEMBLY_ACC=CAM_ASM_000603 /LENGTH=377 /DNA_ID=CAMNT_0004763763 /DNA_START=67 /DNA_END=1196 /DNA_ORIENTATION=-
MEGPILLFKKDNLSPEQLRAVEILEQAQSYTNVETVPSLQELATKDSKILVKKKLRTKDLPKGGGWTWNQSRGRKCTQNINNTIDLCFYKLTTRVRANTGENPGYKLWIFNITNKANKTTSSFLWCERGRGDNENENNEEYTQPINVNGSNWSTTQWTHEQKPETFAHYASQPGNYPDRSHTLAPLKISGSNYFAHSPNAFASPTGSPTVESRHNAAATLTNIYPREAVSLSQGKNTVQPFPNANGINHIAENTLPPLTLAPEKKTGKISTASAVRNLASLSTTLNSAVPKKEKVTSDETSPESILTAFKATPFSLATFDTKTGSSESNPAESMTRQVPLPMKRSNFSHTAPATKEARTVHISQLPSHGMLRPDRST